jgi:hypothetical protein
MNESIYPGGCMGAALFVLCPIGLVGVIVHTFGQAWVDRLLMLGLLAIIGGGIFASVVERRRSVLRHRRWSHRCLHCGYSLTGNVSGYCPECGTPDVGA